MDSKELMYSGGNNDECYTPDYGVTPILKYIPKDAKVWCPFDTEKSEFVKQISQTHSVEYSHIDECFIDYCIYCEKHKKIARKDFCLEKIRSGNICKDCLSLLVKQTGSSQ